MENKTSCCSSLIIWLFFLFQNKEVKEAFKFKVNTRGWAGRTMVHLWPLKRRTSSSLALLDHSSSFWTACTNSTSPKPARSSPKHNQTPSSRRTATAGCDYLLVHECVYEWMKRLNVWMWRQDKYLQVFRNLKGSKNESLWICVIGMFNL